jgi:type IV secretion system protein VirB10
MSAPRTDQLDGERSGANDAVSPEAAARRTRAAQVIGVTTLFLVGGYLLVGVIRSAAPPPKPEKKPDPVRAMVSYVEPNIAPKTQPSPEPARQVAASIGRSTEPPKDDVLEAARRAPLTAYSTGFKAGLGQPSPNAHAPGTSHVVDADPKDNAFAKRFQATAFDVARAGHIGDRRFIVAQGTSIPCVLETAMQSDQPGFVSCVVSRDVLSDNGRVVLMEKGTQVVGEYRGGMSQGQSRLHVMWSRAKTPEGVVVTLASAATDALGRAGVGGYVDNHWWARFGSALLLSIVSDASSAGSSALKAKAGVEANGTSQAGTQAAAIAVEQSSQIKPTLHKNQGDLVSIFVARDLDFSSIYRLAVTPDSGAWRNIDAVPVDASGRPRSYGGTK